ncbi:MAG: hypothetical protein DMF60_13835 [Acidobacteria bacterium]|nr:MAG: hypothetical protein DMF60_13835 [Acidobacteriota bacterium]
MTIKIYGAIWLSLGKKPGKRLATDFVEFCFRSLSVSAVGEPYGKEAVAGARPQEQSEAIRLTSGVSVNRVKLKG